MYILFVGLVVLAVLAFVASSVWRDRADVRAFNQRHSLFGLNDDSEIVVTALMHEADGVRVFVPIEARFEATEPQNPHLRFLTMEFYNIHGVADLRTGQIYLMNTDFSPYSGYVVEVRQPLPTPHLA